MIGILLIIPSYALVFDEKLATFIGAMAAFVSLACFVTALWRIPQRHNMLLAKLGVLSPCLRMTALRVLTRNWHLSGILAVVAAIPLLAYWVVRVSAD